MIAEEAKITDITALIFLFEVYSFKMYKIRLLATGRGRGAFNTH